MFSHNLVIPVPATADHSKRGPGISPSLARKPKAEIFGFQSGTRSSGADPRQASPERSKTTDRRRFPSLPLYYFPRPKYLFSFRKFHSASPEAVHETVKKLGF